MKTPGFLILIATYGMAAAMITTQAKEANPETTKKAKSGQAAKSPEGEKNLEDKEKEDPKESKRAKTRKFMMAKLGSSQEILMGLLTEDFKKINSGADNMLKMSNQLAWNLLDEAFYDNFTDEFQRLTREMKKAAKAKKLDRATLLYMQMTATCIDCHTATRPYPIAGVPRLPEERLTRLTRK